MRLGWLCLCNVSNPGKHASIVICRYCDVAEIRFLASFFFPSQDVLRDAKGQSLTTLVDQLLSPA
jgi:hypothetical protein